MAKKIKKINLVRKFQQNKKIDNGLKKIKIRIIGIGGGGSSIVSELSREPGLLKRGKISFVVANTDLQALKTTNRKISHFQFGESLTGGLGCGMNFELGRKIALTEKERIKRMIDGADFSIFVATLGGGTGSGSGPIFAEVSRNLKQINLGIFTLPFEFEGENKRRIAENSLKEFGPYLNAIVKIPNERIFQIVEKDVPLAEALSTLNKFLAQALKGLIEMIYSPGLINIDFADLKTILKGRGQMAYLASVLAEGSNRAEEVSKRVLASPLNEYNIAGMDKILFNIEAAKDLGMLETEEISKSIFNFNPKAKIIFGISENKKIGDKIRVTLLAVGGKASAPEVKRPKKIKLKKRKIRVQKKLKEKAPPQPETKGKEISGEKIRPQPEGPREESESKKEIERKSVSGSTRPTEEPAEKPRKSALDLLREVEEAEREMAEEEKKWETPAFLRRRKIP